MRLLLVNNCKQEILDLKYLKFIKRHENILLLGPKEVGKLHLPTVLGILTSLNRISTYFISCNDLMLQLMKRYSRSI